MVPMVFNGVQDIISEGNFITKRCKTSLDIMVRKIKAIGLYKTGEPSVLEAVQIDDPTPDPTDLKVRIKAVSINPRKNCQNDCK